MLRASAHTCGPPSNKVVDSDEEPQGAEEGAAYDFLAHFLPHTGARDMTAAEARAATERCIAAFEERAAARARLMQEHAAEVEAQLTALTGRVEGEAHLLLPAEARALGEQADAARFQLGVLRKRLQAHAAGLEGARAALAARVATDRRIAAALHGA